MGYFAAGFYIFTIVFFYTAGWASNYKKEQEMTERIRYLEDRLSLLTDEIL